MPPKSGLVALAATVLLFSSTACSGSANQGTDSATLTSSVRTPLLSDPPPLDPDTFYQPEGLLIMTSAYQGLVHYAPGSTEIQGLLATRWTISPDGLTYTFALRPGVKFADGTPFDAAAAKASFQRRIDMAGGPSYMLAELADMQTPDPMTFVVRLKKPVAPFLDYLASPYGPLMTSPTAVAQHAAGGDHATAWLAAHTAGTGPYELTEAIPADHYTLKANANYWGTAPRITTTAGITTKAKIAYSFMVATSRACAAPADLSRRRPKAKRRRQAVPFVDRPQPGSLQR